MYVTELRPQGRLLKWDWSFGVRTSGGLHMRLITMKP